jgi:hypothetical protein
MSCYRTELIKIDEIEYKRHHWLDGGLTTESPCDCFGSKYRVHSNIHCPWLKKRLNHETNRMEGAM